MLVSITGASGFIGSYAAGSLKRAGHTVRAYVRESSRRDHIQPFVDEFVVGQQDDLDAYRKLVDGADCVIHDAVDFSVIGKDPIRHFRENLLGSLDLIELARTAGATQFIFVSSVAAVGDIQPEWNGVLDEMHPAWPTSLYGGLKSAVEAHVKAYHHQFGFNVSAWRPAAVYGIDPKLDKTQWGQIVKRIKAGQDFKSDKGGKITHVQDVADALTLAVGDASVSGEIYTLVDCYLYWTRVAQIAAELTGSDSAITPATGDGPKNQFDCTKAIDFFNRHGNSVALRRGVEGVRAYVKELLAELDAAKQ